MRRSTWSRYGTAVLAVLTSLILSILLQPLIAPSRFLLFYPAVAFSAWYGGLGPSLLAILLSAVALAYFFLAPQGTWDIGSGGLVQMAIWALAALFVAILSETLRQAQKAEQRQREQLHVTLSSIGDAAISTDVKGNVTFMNPVAEKLTGFTRAEAMDKPLANVFRIINENTRQPVSDPITRVLREGIVVGLANHSVLVARNGAEIPIDDTGAPIRDERGKILGAILVFHDVTKQRQAQQTEARLAAIVEGSDDAILGKDLNGIITSWNKGAERMYGYSADEAIGRSVSILAPPGRPDETDIVLDRIRRGERVEHYETQRLRKDGTVLDVSLTVSPVYDATGRIVGASKIARDITEHKRAEQVLRDSEARLRRLIETAPVAIITIDEHGSITFINDLVTTMFGYEPEEVLGHPIEILLPARFQTVHSGHRDDFFDSPSARPMGKGRDLAGRRKDGSEFPVEVGLSYLQTKDELLALAFITDITERVRLIAEVREYAETLEQKVAERTQELREALVLAQGADKAKSALLSTVSHEMRTPLSSIIGFSNLILNRKPAVDKIMEYSTFINAEARRLANLINDFLDLQRIEAGREVFRFVEVDLATLIRDVAKKQQLGDSRPRTIHLELDPVPPVYADAERIRQVLLNLLSNAIKYASEGEITIRLRTEDDQVICSVQDRGLGIPSDELEYLFERFYRGGAAERLRIRGTGLGLALCREIIQAHGGRIWADSPGPNRGSTFSFSLPVSRQSIRRVTMPSTVADPTNRLMVLVEDDPNFSTYLADRLEPEGYKVQTLDFEAATPEHIAELHPALILLDILKGDQQPGWTLLSALKQHPVTRSIPVLVCTILNNPQRAWQLGASAYIVKPVDEEFLLAELARFIGPAPRKVLIVDDNQPTRTLLSDTLSGAGYQTDLAEDGRVAIERLKSGWPDLIILDLLMPDVDGFAVLDWIRGDQHNLEVPVIAFTAAELTSIERKMLIERASTIASKAKTSPHQLLGMIREMLALPQ